MSTATAMLTISIVINTYNRASYLKRLLVGLNQLCDVDFEVIVVNGPSTDETELLLEQYRGRLKAIQCPTRNLSYSRNLGIAASAGDIIVFIDDDALPADRQWLNRIVQAFADDIDGRLGAVGGAVWQGDTQYYEFLSGAT